MASLDELKLTFFDECSELLQDMESGLTDMQDGAGTADTVNAVFRAVHSVKGGAGIFGFQGLVNFAHVFETVLDLVRRGDLAATSPVVSVFLTAGDVLADLVGMARSGTKPPADYGQECRVALERLTKDGGEGDAPAADDDGMEGIDFTPVAVDDMEGIDFTPVRADSFGDASSGYAITFRPKPGMLQNANEPLLILRELGKLGELELTAETDALPNLRDLQPDQPYVSWRGVLRGAASKTDIESVFEFVVDDCDLTIEPIETPVETPEPMPAMAMEPTPAAVAAPIETIASAAAKQPAAPKAADSPASTAESAPEPRSGGGGGTPAATTARVDLDKIDRVVNMVGELVIAQAMLGQVAQGLPEESRGQLSQILEEVIHHTRELKDSVMSMRAQPVRAVFQRMPRLVRELSQKTGKKVKLEMVGEGTEVDRTIIERLSDPLTHIIRNSVDHGIETPEARIAAGKNEEGTIRLSANHRGGRIVIEIRDDGGGINTERVLKRARERGLVDPDAQLSEDEISNLIFLPGFSTAEAVSDISGRGVGMDVVRSNIQDLGGRIFLNSQRGKGMTIQFALPLTLAVMDGMVIKVGQETYVTPMSTIVECLRPSRKDVHALLGTRGMLQLRGELVPLVHLGELLSESGVGGKDLADGVVIITEAGEGSRLGLVVDELLGHQQVVIKSIEDSYGAVPGIAAATILGNGRVAFILDTEKLQELAAEGFSPLRDMPGARMKFVSGAALH
ncbi:chemotaxis protein CheA [Terrarubrum flagellatum]|uniref:chemotaxis protein CheA n=1 Tax=Terrirubrum flagellatum TaxID=2895980 RepID=UPI003145426C